MKPGDELLFLALGGSGEIGMNVNLYGCRGKWIMVDLGLTFAYPGSDGAPVLKDVSFSLEPGRTLGVVGPSGAGKSTLAHLIPRFYDVSAGRITLDGRDLREIELESLRQTVNLVGQEVFLFDDSIERNITYAAPEAVRRTMREAAQVAHIHDHVQTLASERSQPVSQQSAGS